MSRVAILAAIAVLSAGVAALTAGEASAQAAPADGQAAGLRYLAWNGRSGPPATPATPVAEAPLASGAPGLRRPNLVIPHGGFSAVAPAPSRATAATAARQPGLTPANAWMHRASPPTPTAPEPAALAEAARAIAPLPVARRVAQPATPAPAPARPMPDYLPDQGGRGQPAPAEAVYAPAQAPVAEAPAFDPADPMAPRRDAPIFRMQRSAPVAPSEVPAVPAPARAAAATPREAAPVRVATVSPNTADRPTVQGARYYSVHRQEGRQPDPIAIPEPTYVDAMAISVPESMASQDLSQPAEPPTLIRDSQGHLRAAPAASDGDHQ